MDPLYIQIVNGFPVNHPAFESNLITAFGAVPDDWKPFNRVPAPVVGLYQVIDPLEPTYQFLNDYWCDCWTVREMTENEISAKQQPVKDAWANRPYASNFTAWIFDVDTLSYKPPVPRPTDGQNWRWSGAENGWKIAPPIPDNGNRYMFDFDNWTWVQVTQGT